MTDAADEFEETRGSRGRTLIQAVGLGAALLATVPFGLQHSWHPYLMWAVAIPGIALSTQFRRVSASAFFEGALLAPLVLGLIQIISS